VPAPARRWGWHPLEPRWAARFVADAALPPGALVLDLGAGLGALTGPLVESGARVLAVEAHPGRARRLRERFGDAVVVLSIDLADLRLPHRPFHVVANPPFAHTSEVLRLLLRPGSRLVSARLVLEAAAVRRWTGPAAPGARRWARTFSLTAGPPVPRCAFRSPPPVSTRVLEMSRSRHDLRRMPFT
jgi:23S rRNA (adenine-N6)-dimethyltransferase